MEKGKKIILWVIGVFFIITFFVYINQIIIPSILILITGIILLPPVNEKIEKILSNEERIDRYKIIRNVIVIVFFLIFVFNIPVKGQNIDNDTTINQAEIDESVATTITEKNGKYTGEKIDGKKEGNGKFEWNDGSVYEGEFSNDQINGQGKLTIPQKGTYEGSFVNGKKSGQGTYTFANGDIYQGNWIDDEMSGQGTYTFANGDNYVGEFSSNKFNGQGTYTKGNNKYTGTWSDNEYKK